MSTSLFYFSVDSDLGSKKKKNVFTALSSHDPKNLVQWTVNFEEKKTGKGICRGKKSTKQNLKKTITSKMLRGI